MKILVFGASGMVGQGVLRECLLDVDVSEVKCVGRSPVTVDHPKFRQLVAKDLYDLDDEAEELTGYDACFFTLGASAAGLSEAQYSKINFDLPMAVARTLVKLNPTMVFVYVSGANTDSSEKGRIMWARIKGRTENEIMKLPFRAASMFRPGMILAKHGEVSRTPLYRHLYLLSKPIHGALAALFPKSILTTEQVGRAMLNATKYEQGPRILEIQDIQELAARN